MRSALFRLTRQLSADAASEISSSRSLDLSRLRKEVMEAPLGRGALQKVLREAVGRGFRRPQGLTMLLTLCGTQKQGERAMEVFRAAQSEGMKANSYTYNALLNALCRTEASREAESVYREMIESGVLPSSHTFGAMITAMDTCKRPDKALQLFRKYIRTIKEPNLIIYNKTMSALANSKWWKECVELLEEMFRIGLRPDSASVIYVTRALLHCPDHWTVSRTMQKLERGADDAGVYTSLMGYHARLGKWDKIIELYESMIQKQLQPTPRVYNNVIIAFGKCGLLDEAMAAFHELQALGHSPDGVLYSSLIDSFGKVKKWEKSLEFFNLLLKAGHRPNVLHYTALISSLEKGQQWKKAIEIFEVMKSSGVEPNLITYNALISACEKGGQTEKAFRFFNELVDRGLQPDTISFSALICACEKQGEWERALSVYGNMQKQGVAPNDYTYRALLDVLVRAGQIQTATEIHRDAYKRGIFCHFDKEVGNLGQIDLHNASSAGAVAVLVAWLRSIKRSHMLGDTFADPEALIITGWGRRSEELGQSKVRETVMDFLMHSSKRPLPFKVPERNRGRFLVDADILRHWIMHDACLT